LKRLIVTGGNGFIGGHLVKKLLESKQCSLVLISNRSRIDREMRESMPLRFYTSDIRDKETISNIFRDERADACIHLAAKISVADSIRKPDETMDINANGTLNVLEACHKSGVNNFVFASSAAVYGDVKQLPITENQILRPLSPYGSSKMLAEQFIAAYQKQNKIKNTISLRIFNVYGEGQASEADVITRFAKRLSSGQPPAIYGNGMQTRDFISVDDVVDAILLSIRSMENAENKESTTASVFNVGTGTPTSINQLAQKMIAIFGLNLQPTYEDGEEGQSGILHSYADMTKAKEILHFVPKKGIETGLKEMIGAMTSRSD
jgi:UDP-glucose 4-epimerase